MSEAKKKLYKHNLRPIKSFGQNFLSDNKIIKKIVNAETIVNKQIIEIGPGLGNLTQELVKTAKKVVAIEIDKKLVPILREEFIDNYNIKIINQDFLKINIQQLIADEFNSQEDIIVIANLPYYLTSPIIIKLLENVDYFSSFVLMMQKEVAQRLSAQPNNKVYNNLSVMVQYYCQVSILFDVKPQSFFPQPKITSSVVLFTIKKQRIKINEDKF